MAVGECSVAGCDRDVVARGWCSAHYFRWRKHGDVLADRPVGQRRSRSRHCSVPRCGRVVKARGWCRVHYERWRRFGSVQADIPIQVKSNSGTIVLSACVWVSRHAGKGTLKRARELADRGGRYLVSASGAFLDRLAQTDDGQYVTDDNIDEIAEWLERTVDDG